MKASLLLMAHSGAFAARPWQGSEAAVHGDSSLFTRSSQNNPVTPESIVTTHRHGTILFPPPHAALETAGSSLCLHPSLCSKPETSGSQNTCYKLCPQPPTSLFSLFTAGSSLHPGSSYAWRQSFLLPKPLHFLTLFILLCSLWTCPPTRCADRPLTKQATETVSSRSHSVQGRAVNQAKASRLSSCSCPSFT